MAGRRLWSLLGSYNRLSMNPSCPIRQMYHSNGHVTNLGWFAIGSTGLGLHCYYEAHWSQLVVEPVSMDGSGSPVAGLLTVVQLSERVPWQRIESSSSQ